MVLPPRAPTIEYIRQLAAAKKRIQSSPNPTQTTGGPDEPSPRASLWESRVSVDLAREPKRLKLDTNDEPGVDLCEDSQQERNQNLPERAMLKCNTKSTANVSTEVSSISSSAPPQVTTKGWTLDGLVALGKRTQPVPRVSALQDGSVIEEEIRKSEAEGTPLIIEDWHKAPCWPRDDLFTAEWLLENGDECAYCLRNASRPTYRLPST